MTVFLEKVPTMDIQEIDRLSLEILSTSGSIAELERKYNIKSYPISSEYFDTINEKDRITLQSYWIKIKKLSEELDFVFLED